MMPTAYPNRVGASGYIPRDRRPWLTRAPQHDAGCACPVCAGLKTFVRPRFFAGQLLSDGELTALTSYVVDKQRLHNVHLHGWGVVCGLQVECDNCGPGVTVRAGYAIDPCGYDIVVPQAANVDVVKLIQQCQVGDRLSRCDPPQLPNAKGCDDEETWCLTVRYREQDSRAIAPLGGSAACSCGGTCNGAGKSGACGCGSSTGARNGWQCGCADGSSRSTTTCGCNSAPRPASRPADCEPSRTYELYDFGVCRSDGSCHDLGPRLNGTFPARVLECIREIQPVVAHRMTSSHQRNAGALLLGGSSGAPDENSRQAVCTLYQNVVELYRKDPMRTQCVLPEQLNDIDCNPREEDETEEHYRTRLIASLQAIVALVLMYLRDCVCYHIMPPCPDAPCDDRVVLACMTVKDGKVVSICNHDCRRYAGSFVSRDYWLPIGPVLSWLAGLICCFPLLKMRSRRGRVTWRDSAAFYAGARYANLRQVLVKDDFAVVSLWRTRLSQLVRRLRPSALLEQLDTSMAEKVDHVALASYVNTSADRAEQELQRSGVSVEQVPVAADWAAPITDLVPSVAAGGTAKLYVHEGKVIGVAAAPADSSADATQKDAAAKPSPRRGKSDS